MSDVARRAGVSRATASYVLNRTPGARIPEQTRARVLEAAEQLRYVPHVNARSLRRGRSDLVVGHVDGASVLRQGLSFVGLIQVARDIREAGYTFLFHGDPTVTGVAAARSWLALRPAAVLATLDRYTEESVAMITAAGTVPIAMSHTPSDLTPTIVLDDGPLGRAAAEHLLGRGCRRIVALGGCPGMADQHMLGHRMAEAVAAARAGGAEARQVPFSPGREAATGLVGSWLAEGTLPDGVVGATTTHAAHVLTALVDAGVRVPQDVAVLAADDEPLAELVRPRLTTVGADLDVGEARMGAAVLAAIDGRWDPDLAVRRFPARMVVRETA
ncbi:LacI family DNA-binding transcriptional regulator [Pseudonocardia xishanensis]|uniref:LacI family DNA-binding transcriptional regulator n=1 Tax=Pseudonocardia xishanensis TaxID=630995 RepID=A0ABP8RYR3_9PSEU